MSEHDAEKKVRKVLLVALVVFVAVTCGINLATAGATGVITPNSIFYPIDLYLDGVKCRICKAFGTDALISAHLSNLNERFAEILWALDAGEGVKPAVEAYEAELSVLKAILSENDEGAEVKTLTLLDAQETLSEHQKALTPRAATLGAEFLNGVESVTNLTCALIEKRTAEKLSILRALEEKVLNKSIKVEFPMSEMYPEGLTLVVRDRGKIVKKYLILINTSSQEVFLGVGQKGELMYVDLEYLEVEDLKEVSGALEDLKISIDDLALILKARGKLL